MPEMRPPRLAWRVRLSVAAAALLAALALAACEALLMPLQTATPAPAESAPSPQVVRVAACWAALPLAEDLRAAYTVYRPSVAIEIAPMLPEHARDAIAAGHVDLAILSAPDENTAMDGPPGLHWQLLARDGLAVIVHWDLRLEAITAAELEALYAGRVADWSLLGAGEGTPSFAVQSPGTTSRQVFDKAVMLEREVSGAALVLPHDEAVLAWVADNPLAIGYVSAAYLSDDARIRPLAVDGELPTRSRLEQGGYPLGYGIYIARAPDATGEAARLHSFALSRAGREVISQRYGLP
jgi:phosphate transport system substrate-binding protein